MRFKGAKPDIFYSLSKLSNVRQCLHSDCTKFDWLRPLHCYTILTTSPRFASSCIFVLPRGRSTHSISSSCTYCSASGCLYLHVCTENSKKLICFFLIRLCASCSDVILVIDTPSLDQRPDVAAASSMESCTGSPVDVEERSAHLRAHRVILCARSEYFGALFRSGMRDR
jgi:hypothetical protein